MNEFFAHFNEGMELFTPAILIIGGCVTLWMTFGFLYRHIAEAFGVPTRNPLNVFLDSVDDLVNEQIDKRIAPVEKAKNDEKLKNEDKLKNDELVAFEWNNEILEVVDAPESDVLR